MSKNEICKVCQGQGGEYCPNCNHGWVNKCFDCTSGVCRSKDPATGAVTRVSCGECAGKGYFPADHYVMSAAIACPTCDATSRMSCIHCRGRGVMPNSSPAKPA